MATSTFLARRLLLGAFTLLVAVTLVFSLIHLTPGDPVAILLGESYSPEAYTALQHKLGLDKPLIAQYGAYLSGLARGQWGTSFRTQRDVLRDIATSFPYTFRLAAASIAFALLIGLPAGVLSAVYRNRWPDRLGMVLALIGVCVPNFWLGVLLMLLFSLELHWLPALGAGGPSFSSVLSHLILPAVTLGTASSALIARMMRSSLLEALQQDYIRTARSKGAGTTRLLLRHAIRNSMIPVITVAGINLGHLLAGTTVTEIVFSRPGVGHLLIEGLLARDYPQIQGTLMFFVLVIVLVNIVVDILYAAVDPRIRLA